MRILILAGLALVAAGGASAQEVAPDVAQRMVACRDIAEADRRLACYDQAVAAFAQARETGDVVVVDREQIRETNRTLFGFSLPELSRLGGDGDEVVEQTYVIREARQSPLGGWVLEMEDGSVWRQVDGRRMPRPRSGSEARVERGRLGGYMMSINGAPSIRVERDR